MEEEYSVRRLFVELLFAPSGELSVVAVELAGGLKMILRLFSSQCFVRLVKTPGV